MLGIIYDPFTNVLIGFFSPVNHDALCLRCLLGPCYLKCGLWVNSIMIPRELGKNAGPQLPFQN